jgi:4Fe-4S ferredoxin
LHVKGYKLTLDKKRCVGCQICSLACPKEAVKVEKQPKTDGEKAKKAKVDIDLAKCNFCGICDASCPYGAIKVTVDGKHVLSIVEKESFPRLSREIHVDPSKCPVACVECENACPLDLIKVSWATADGKNIENIDSLTEGERAGLKVRVDVQEEYCPCCRICEIKCSEGVMRVRKFIQGNIAIHAEKCPKDCTDCLDVCPITGTLSVCDADRKVHVNELFCTYCGACKIVCPAEEALEFRRTRISHMPVRSGAWNKALERMTSPVEVTKELKIKGSLKARESVKKRIGLKET